MAVGILFLFGCGFHFAAHLIEMRKSCRVGNALFGVVFAPVGNGKNAGASREGDGLETRMVSAATSR
jgi:hypothetical protein